MSRHFLPWRRFLASTTLIPYLVLGTGLSHSLHHSEDHHHCHSHAADHSDEQPSEEKRPESDHSHDCGLCYLITASVAAETVSVSAPIQPQRAASSIAVFDAPAVPVLGTSHAPRAPPFA